MAGNAGGHGASVGSWVAAVVIMVGFAVGGVALIYWNWPVFWAGVGITVVGCIAGGVVGIMDDVTEYGGHGPGGDPQTG